VPQNTAILTPSIFEVRLFGGFDARLNGKSLPPLRSRREQWLLALLVLRQDRDTARDWLATTLWPDNDEQQALFYLRKSLSNLRQALQTEATRVLAPTQRTVRLDMTGAFADVVAFDRALKKTADSADFTTSLQEAISLYRGPLLSDCLEEWAAVERNQREQAYLTALESLAAHFYGQGEPANAVHWLRLLIAADPYRESAHVTLMAALADCGDYAAVTVVYQELRALLRQDLNTSPSQETEAIYRQLSKQKRPAATLPPPPAPSSTRRHLPVPLSNLIGREREIAEVLDCLQDRRLVTLLGAGGVGKTRLSIAVAESAMPQFEDGVWFVDLASLSESALAPHTIAKALGIAEEGTHALTETLAEALEQRSLLLVLDNCEHLLDACADLAYALLTTCPRLHIIATSRQSLNIMGEQVYQVPSLLVPPHEPLGIDADVVLQDIDPHVLMEYEAVRLFVDRAVRANKSFQLNHRTAPAVVEICRQLDGIPLAIEMAAARLRSLSVTEINTRLEDRFRLLTSGNRGVLPRQQTLRAAVDWSYDLLSEAERLLLRRLSVFAGGWTAEAAEAVCTSVSERDDIQDLLSSLVDKSLVVTETLDETTRYRMLETIRQYARERLHESEASLFVYTQHRDHFLALAKTSRTKLSGAERVHWLSILDAEYDNLRHALRFCLDQPNSGEQGLRLSASLWGFWLVRGYLSEGRILFAAALSHLGAQSRSAVRADALNGAGALAQYQGDYTAAITLFEEALALYMECGNHKGAGNVRSNRGNVAAMQSDYPTARRLHEENLAQRRESGDRSGLTASLNTLGIIAQEQGDYVAARAFHEECLPIWREFGDLEGVAMSLNNLGILADIQKDYTAAHSLFSESLEIHRKIGPRTSEAANLAGLGNVALHRGNCLEARERYQESLAIRRHANDDWGIAICLQGLGSTEASLGDYTAARALFEESLTILQKIGNQQGIATALKTLATQAHGSNQHERAARLWGAMSALQEAIGAPLTPVERDDVEEEQATSKVAIGAAAFATAWDAGRAMTMGQAIQYALEP
jgi:predicted ATPase/DNA-binding SARP family transcriptional activator